MELSPFEVHYIVDSVAANVRPDGRHNLQYRPFTLQLSVFPNTFGSARLYYPSDGNQIYASIKAEIVKPLPGAPDEGIVKFYLDSTYESKRQTQEEYARLKQEVISTLETMLINKQGGINPRWLGIQSGIFCWQLHVDLLVFQPISLVHLDAMAIAIRAALADMVLPKVSVFFNQNTKNNDFEIEEGLVSLSEHAKTETELPTVVTMGVHEGNYVVDMTREEYAAVGNKLVVSMAPNGDLLGVETFGASISPEELDRAVDVVSRVKDKINKTVAAGIKRAKEKGKTTDVDIN